MTSDELESAVLEWSRARRIIPRSTPSAQFNKAVSELGELADAMVAGSAREVCDAIGDTVVCLINVCALKGGMSARQCHVHAPALVPADTPTEEFVRMVGAFGRLSDALMKGEPHEELVGIIMRRLSEIALAYSLTLRSCLEVSYRVIEFRKGELLESGVFVKEA